MSQINNPPEGARPSHTRSDDAPELERGTYEIILNRLKSHGETLRQRLDTLNEARREVFGSIPTELISTQRITTEHNCIAQDIVPVGDHFIFGYNVQMGLKSSTELADVFTTYRFGDDGLFHEVNNDLLNNKNFDHDFHQLYKYYKETRFLKFHLIEPYVYFVFQIGKSTTDFKSFKFLISDGNLVYQGNRSDHEVVFPPQHDFEWKRTHRDLHRGGTHPHISIEDRVFVETVGGDLTIKIEDNTEDGEGIYREPVDDPDQSLDDAEVFYAVVGNLVLLKIKPFRETKYRYLIYNEKTHSVQRMDTIAHACVALPEDHGLIFANGFYLQTGVCRTFDNQLSDLNFERRIVSPNGEDFLYVFHNRHTGQKVLLSYNMIEQAVQNPILCNGFSIFESGKMLFFRSDASPQKHHAVQIWQTPFIGSSVVLGEQKDSFIYKIGNKEIVRAMAECHEVLNLIQQEDSYQGLYLDLVRTTTGLLDSYFWLDEAATFEMGQPLRDILQASTAAVDEFEKVVRVRRNTQQQFQETSKAANTTLSKAVSRPLRQIDDFVDSLASLRIVRGQVISLKELRYIDLASVEALETRIAENQNTLSRRCVEFLLQPDALQPYADRVQQQEVQIEQVATVAKAKVLAQAIDDAANELEMLIEIVSNLKIEDATQRTHIIDGISTIYSNLNQTRAKLRRHQQALLTVEGEAEFSSQMKLLDQAVTNYLEVTDTPQRCDEFLTKIMVQLEEVEGKFAEFDQFLLQLAEKRDEIYSAFDSKKLQLVEARSRRATTLAAAAERILTGVRSRISNFKSVDEINSYFAADLMIEKIRELIGQLQQLEESVKIDDIQSQLKTIREDAVRQLRDKQDLYVDGQNIIKFGRHQFSVNTQPLDLTMIQKQGEYFFHLSGTNYFEKVDHPQLLANRAVWDQSLISENRQIYRAEYLAWLMLQQIKQQQQQESIIPVTGTTQAGIPKVAPPKQADLIAPIQKFMANRYSEGYIKGVHDRDAAKILKQLLVLDTRLGLLKHDSSHRALATLFWHQLQLRQAEQYQFWKSKLISLGRAQTLFGHLHQRQQFVDRLSQQIDTFLRDESLDWNSSTNQAADYLFDQLTASSTEWVVSKKAAEIVADFQRRLTDKNAFDEFVESIRSNSLSIVDQFHLIREWISASIGKRFLSAAQTAATGSPLDANGNTGASAAAAVEHSIPDDRPEKYIDESVLLIQLKISVAVNQHDQPVSFFANIDGPASEIPSVVSITGLLGDHPLLQGKAYRLDYHEFVARLSQFQQQVVPAFETFSHLKKQVTDQRRNELRLEEFQTRVLSSFVRNRLINDSYLPLIGANLAKQVGVVGEDKRTDLNGMLLLISPPGYGKTTLMEYVADRLGITFVKISGPALGHGVTSLDPTDAPNASAREEVQKLNLALEMGDNVMIYVDDIQHCHPEFLQKFIPLCDSTRRIEGVFRGQTKTYDLRGRKVAVVMAGNPYTESGDKFQIPDMLASRSDTYNLGDVIGDNRQAFELSYIENALTSNSTLSRLNTRSQSDVYRIITMAQRPEEAAVTLDGNYSIEEINEFASVMKKMLQARETILAVNREYIRSAAQADEYRTEPAFKLQGSYRDMNKIVEKIAPLMNDQELDQLIRSHYLNQAQTLGSDAEGNLLKLDELMETLSGESLERWSEIKRTFQRNLLLGSVDAGSQIGQLLAQLTTFGEGLQQIRLTLSRGVKELVENQNQEHHQVFQSATLKEVSQIVAELARVNQRLEQMGSAWEASQAKQTGSDELSGLNRKSQIQVVNRIPPIFLDVIRNQFSILQTWLEPIMELAATNPQAAGLKQAMKKTEHSYRRLVDRVGDEEVDDEDNGVGEETDNT